MKLYIYFLLIALQVLNACSKEQHEPQEPKKIAVTSYYYKHDTKWNLLDSGLSFHWHDTDPEIRAQFDNRTRDTFCFTISTYFIHEDECEKNQPMQMHMKKLTQKKVSN